MKFDVVIGNPPYQESTEGNNRSVPIYNFFIDSAFCISNTTCLITPARFLFNAGQTPQHWNTKMLNDKHLKVASYYDDSSNVFSGTDIKGGVAIIYRNVNVISGPIVFFVREPILMNMIKKVKSQNKDSLSKIHFNRSSYRLTENLYHDFPELLERTKFNERFSIGSNIFNKFPEIFSEKYLCKENEKIGVLGRKNNERLYQWIDSDFMQSHDNLKKYKVFIAKSNGTGEYGEKLSEAEIGHPYTASTQTFISFGSFSDENEAISLKKYIETKFLRSLLGISKVTPDNARKSVWEYVPLEDFSKKSDIDWSKSVSEIDQQLYKKYNLSEEEINFIETNVKEME